MHQSVLVILLVLLLAIGTALNLVRKGDLTVPTIPHTYRLTGAYERSRVQEVIDGDTFILTNGEHIRTIGINAPEIAHDGSTAECFGEEAKNAAKTLVEGKIVSLLADTEERDVYGRLLRYVFVGTTFMNEELVRHGMARTLPIEPNTRFQSVFQLAQQEAKNRSVGLWGKCMRVFVDK